MTDVLEREVDGRLYRVTPLPAWQALELQVKLLQIIGPVLGKLRAKDAGESVFQGIAEALVAAKPSEVVALSRQLLQGTQHDADGKWKPTAPAVDTLFQGRISSLLRVLALSLESNFGDFTAALAGLTAKVQAGLAHDAASPSPPLS